MTGIQKVTQHISYPSPPPTVQNAPLLKKRTRPGKKERQRIAERKKQQERNQKRAQKYDEGTREHNLELTNTPEWAKRPDWEIPTYHCPACHFTSEGEYHWGCSSFPGLTDATCPTCNTREWVDIFHINPWLSLVDNPLLSALTPLARTVRGFYLDYNQWEYYKQKLIDLVITLVIVYLARLL